MEYCRTNMNMEEGRSDNRGKLEPQDQHQPPPRRGEPAGNGRHQPAPPRKCPRCESANTKFCYYNNYSLSQPRYFCKACRRYWTHGGTLRNVPVGGGCRKGKRQRLPTAAASSSRPPPNSSPAIPSTNSSGMIGAESSIRAFPPSMSDPVYSGGGFLTSLAPATVQSTPGAANHGAAAGLSRGNSHYGANLALLQGINLSSMMAPPPQTQHQFLAQNEFNTAPRHMTNYLTPGFLNRDTAANTSSAPGEGFWGGGATGDGNNQSGSSFNSTQWSDDSKYHGFLPPR